MQQSNGFENHCLYRVSLRHPEAKMHVANMAYIAPQRSFHDWPDIYWRGMSQIFSPGTQVFVSKPGTAAPIPLVNNAVAEWIPQNLEVLTLSHLVIEERLDPR